MVGRSARFTRCAARAAFTLAVLARGAGLAGAGVQVTGLEEGRVPEEADLLLVPSPRELSDKQVFAIDQFLMRGGSVVLATRYFTCAAQSGRFCTSSTNRWTAPPCVCA